MDRTTAIVILVILVLAIGFGAYFLAPAKAPAPAVPSEPVSNADEAAIRALVTEFGSKFKNVSLLAPDVREQIAKEYAPYVSEALILGWQDNTEAAPGRATSSPWPDRIEIVNIYSIGDSGYQVEGNVIEVTSGAATPAVAAVYPVTLRVEQVNGSWQITGFMRGAYAEVPQVVTVTGLWECLPHRDTSGPQTLECAFGLAKDESDGHLAVSTAQLPGTFVDYPTGTHLRITGLLTPADQLSSDQWQKYDIDGIISATKIEKL